MPPLENLTGQRFTSLTVKARALTVDRKTRWVCQCDCGNEVTVEAGHLKAGHTRSCGCLKDTHVSGYNACTCIDGWPTTEKGVICVSHFWEAIRDASGLTKPRRERQGVRSSEA